jgi:hypothetical protein
MHTTPVRSRFLCLSSALLLIMCACSANVPEYSDPVKKSPADATGRWSTAITTESLEAVGEGEWSNPLSGETMKYLLPLFPDVNATYWTYSWDPVDAPANISFKFTGRFPHARYMSYNCYDFTEASVIAHIRDDMIGPDEGSVNPFMPGTDRTAEERSYTLWFVPEGSPRAGEPNTVVIPAGTGKPTIMYRVYLHDTGTDLDGGTGLPVIEGFDDLTGDPLPCPESSGIDAKTFLTLMLRVVTSGTVVNACNAMAADDLISFYHVEGSGYMPNEDNRYLITGFGYLPEKPVAVLNLLPPSFPRTLTGGGFFTGEEDVRYWSLNMGGNIWTGTSNGICDENASVNGDGSVTVVIGPFFLRSFVEAAGYNFIPWGMHVNRSMIYRQMCPGEGFAGSVMNVPFFDITQPLDDQRAEKFIGGSAPTGRYYTITELFELLGK